MSTSDPTFARNPSAEPPNSESGADAKQRVADVKDTSVQAGQHVAGVASDEMHRVGSETKRQAKDLYQETRTELVDQAAAQQKRVASGIRSLGDEFNTMSESSENQGAASGLAQEAASRASRIADWLDQRDPGSVIEEVKGYARRHPGTFIALAAVAGVVAGRLTRSVIEDSKDSSGSGSSGSSGGSASSATTPPAAIDREAGTGAATVPTADPLRGVDPDVTRTPL